MVDITIESITMIDEGKHFVWNGLIFLMRVWPVRCFCVSLFTCFSVFLFFCFCFSAFLFFISLLPSFCAAFSLLYFFPASMPFASWKVLAPKSYHHWQQKNQGVKQCVTWNNWNQSNHKNKQHQSNQKITPRKQMRKPEKHDTLKSRAAPRPPRGLQ